MTVLEYIKNQLLFTDLVTLPGLGSFEIKRSSSRIEGKKMIPPEAQIFFTGEKSLDDGILAGNIAAAEEISEEEARQKVLEYIDEIVFVLNKGEEFVFSGLGTLYRDSENLFRFEKDPGYKIDFESHGMESFELDPVEELLQGGELPETNGSEIEESTPVAGSPPVKEETGIEPEDQVLDEDYIRLNKEAVLQEENRNNHNIFWILTGALVVILISFILIRMTTDLLDGPGLSVFKTLEGDESELFPEDENWDLESSLNEDLDYAIDSLTLQENALSPQETSEAENKDALETAEYKEFHIIAGSFKDKENAGILQQELTEQGYPALVIQQGDQLYRVSAISFADKGKGLEELTRFKQKTKNNAAWLLGLN